MPTALLLRRIAAPALLFALAACESPSRPEPQPEPDEQTEAEWLAENAHPLRSLSPTDHDFSDLQPLRAAIGNARVVMLGEQSHGDGTTFLAKARLVAFLHQEMGFDVLAWESGIWDMAQVWRQVQAGRAVLPASRGGVFAIWSGSEQVLPTLDYVASTVGTSRPLEMAGFDNQLTGLLARDSLHLLADAFARRIGSPVVDDAGWAAGLATLHDLAAHRYFTETPGEAEQQNLLRLLGMLREHAAARGTADREALHWAQVLESLDAFARNAWAEGGNSNNRRDTQMGRNLVWLADTFYPGRKIIVWAASSHIARDVGHLRTLGGNQPYLTGWSVHMGAEVYRVLGPQMYAIGFTAAEGKFGPYWEAPATIAAPLPVSLEARFVEAGLTNAFLDLRAVPEGGEWLREVYARPFGYGDMRGDWTRVLDGMIFTHAMTPSTPPPADPFCRRRKTTRPGDSHPPASSSFRAASAVCGYGAVLVTTNVARYCDCEMGPPLEEG
jgi:erythromycin esterase